MTFHNNTLGAAVGRPEDTLSSPGFYFKESQAIKLNDDLESWTMSGA